MGLENKAGVAVEAGGGKSLDLRGSLPSAQGMPRKGQKATTWSYFDRNATDDFALTVYEGGDGGYSMGDGGEKVVAVCDDEDTASKIAAIPETIAVLSEELAALRIWRGAKDLPTDIRSGIDISIAKIGLALEKTKAGK